ncbi:MAG: hypothetical protein J6I58_07345 [Eubacterium sp.]|nr:hypothetical protein [Eubacterium sp.]
MKKPFSNAYESIKKLLRNIFGKKGEEVTEEVNSTAEQQTEEAAPEAAPEMSSDDREKLVEEVLASLEKEKKEEAKAPEVAPESKTEAKKAADKAKASMTEEQKYEEEVRKRAERAAKREAEDKKKEAEEVMSSANSNRVRWVTDPVTGEEITLGKLPAEATYLKKYTRIQTTSDDVILSINSILKHPDMPKNIVILGRNGFGTVKVGEDFARSFYSLGLVSSDKIAKTKAKQLNKMGLEKLSALKGGCLIVENAGLVSFDKLVEVIKDSAPENNNYVVILTGEIDSLSNFFEENDEIVDEFIYLIDIHKIKDRGMMHLAKGYVKEKGYTAEKPIFDRLKESLKGMEEGNIDRFVARIDEVMEKCDAREAAAGSTSKQIELEDTN